MRSHKELSECIQKNERIIQTLQGYLQALKDSGKELITITYRENGIGFECTVEIGQIQIGWEFGEARVLVSVSGSYSLRFYPETIELVPDSTDFDPDGDPDAMEDIEERTIYNSEIECQTLSGTVTIWGAE